MSKEQIILLGSWIITAILLYIFVPKNKIREAHVIFLFVQLITWFSGLMVAEFHLIEYPVRQFSRAIKSNFTFEFFVYPGLTILFILYYPEGRNAWRRLFYYVSLTSVITVLEVILEHYTDLIDYIKWDWYWTWISLIVTFYISRHYYLWFYRKKKTTLL